MKIMLTGAAGFIGAACAQRLLARGDDVIGVDNLNAYYDVSLKQARLDQVGTSPGAGRFEFHKVNIADRDAMASLFESTKPRRVLNIAAQAGVRYSLENPAAYIDSNVVGFGNVLEGCRHNDVEHLVYASTSSVYGSNTAMPFSTHHNVDHPVQLYAATKKANESMAHAYSHLYGLPTTGLRFFTVYGPWGRPDMAPFKFTRKILAGEPIPVFNHGHHSRDFTYVDDIVEGVIRALDQPATPNPDYDAAQPDPSSSSAPWRIYNIGSNNPVPLLKFIEVLEDCLGSKAKMDMLPAQPGDVADTFADVDDLVADVGYRPQTSIEVGVRRFVDWYRDFYNV